MMKKSTWVILAVVSTVVAATSAGYILGSSTVPKP